MQYMALIYTNEGGADVDDATLMTQYNAFTKAVSEAGVLKAGDALHPANTATCVRVRGGKQTLTDGPFVESKEALGGYYLLECDTLDEAVKWAAQIPGARYGTIEVRPVVLWE